jgi:hypothetical protein
MTTPSKFDMGRMPRTKTGLVPTSFRRKMEHLSTTKNWSPLPPKPKPPMYKYRGDYVVHERNRTKQKPKQRSFDPNKSRGGGLSTPSLSVVGERIQPYHSSRNWDSYCKHISYHKLTDDEQLSKARNKNEFVSYIRSSAAKRGLNASKDKVVQQTVAETIVRQRKPPVPRLSHLARTGEDKEILQSSAKESMLKQNGQARKDNLTKNGYLDFISNKKVDESRISPHVTKATNTARIRCDEDDDSKLQRQKSQIQRIVERAAEIVQKEQHRATLDEIIGTNIKKAPIKSSLAEIFAEEKGKSGLQRIVRNGCLGQPNLLRAKPVESYHAGPNSEFFREQNEQLSFLEERVRSMSLSVVSEADWFSSSVSHLSYDDPMIAMTQRVQLQPMIKFLHETDPGSFASSSNDKDDGDGRFTVSQSASFDVSAAATSSGIGRLSVEEKSPHASNTATWSGSDTISQKSQSSYRPSFDMCPVESLPPTINPSIEPTREEEPLPRGYKHTLQGYGTTNREYPHTAGTNDSFIDDIFSLFAFDS